jgi:hypothetical protein
MNNDDVIDVDIPNEVDFSGAVRGHFAGRFSRDTVAVVIEPELYAAFPSAEAISEALRLVLKAGALTRRAPDEHQKAS